MGSSMALCATTSFSSAVRWIVTVFALSFGPIDTAVGQRITTAPDAFVQDVNSLAGLSRIGQALLASDPDKKRWGDYCSASQMLAREGQFREAIRTAARALYLGQSTHGNRGAPIIYSSNDIATAYGYAGDWSSASEWADRTLAAVSRGYDSEVHRGVQLIRANAHRLRALAMGERGEHGKALAEMALALDALPNTGTGAVRAELQLAQASLQLKAGQAGEGEALVQRLLDNSDVSIKIGAARLAGQAALAKGDSASATTQFRRALSLANDRKDPYQTVMARLGLVRALRLAGDTDGAASALGTALSELDGLRAGFDSFEMRTALFGNLQNVFDEAVDFFSSTGRAEQALAASEASRARAMLDLAQRKVAASTAAALPARSATAPEIQARLGEGEVLVVYHQLPRKLLAWVVTRDSLRQAVMPAARDDVRDEVTRLRLAIEREDKGVIEQAQAAHAKWVAPLKLEPGKKLWFVPHRALHLLPFHALHDGRVWLVESHDIATTLSASLLEVSREAATPERLAALGNPDLGKAEWALPGAEREVKALSNLYAQASISVLKEATKARLKELAPGADVLHIAAHAVIDEVDPMYSFIKLAPPLPGVTVGTDMEAREFASLDLSRARLVALSACNSGLGKVANGDEFMGFKRALLAAGARSALISLWLVDDEAAEALMVRFHQEWKRGSRAQAIRTAQRHLLSQARFAHPYYWAPFMLVGDPG